MYCTLNCELVIDDDTAKQLQKAYPGRITLKQRPVKLGMGMVYVHGRDFHMCIHTLRLTLFPLSPAFLKSLAATR